MLGEQGTEEITLTDLKWEKKMKKKNLVDWKMDSEKPMAWYLYTDQALPMVKTWLFITSVTRNCPGEVISLTPAGRTRCAESASSMCSIALAKRCCSSLQLVDSRPILPCKVLRVTAVLPLIYDLYYGGPLKTVPVIRITGHMANIIVIVTINRNMT